MPRRDGTGLMGIGSMRGRGFGLRNEKYMYGRGRCFVYGLGIRRGFGIESNKELLQKQKEILELRLKAVEKQLEEL